MAASPPGAYIGAMSRKNKENRSNPRHEDETAYLLSTPANARSLRKSIAQLDAGRGMERKLLDI